MNDLSRGIEKIRRAAGLIRPEGYRPSRPVADTPMYMRRMAYEMEYAFEVSKARGGEFEDTVASACEYLLTALNRDGALTKEACAAAEEILSPMREAAKSYTVHLVGHAHIDMNWMWPYHETVSVTLETFRTMLTLMEEYPEFTFAQSQASTYKIVEEYDPDMLTEIRRRVKEGRWEVSASTWVEADKNMPSEESMVRHLLYTMAYLSKLLDIDPSTLDLDFDPDTFGHSANVPEILTRGGVKYYYHCRGFGDYPIYRWRGQSGAEVLSFCEPTWYLGDTEPEFALYVPAFCEKQGIKDAIKVYGVGDHGGGPTRRDLNLIEEMRTWPIFPTMVYSTYKAFYKKLEEKRETFPVVERELNFLFTGCYTTQCRVKASNRVGEAVLGEAEALSAAARTLVGRPARTKALGKAWEKVLFNQFHDILTGSGVRDTREYALGQFSQALACANTEKAAAMRAVAANMDTARICEGEVPMETMSEGAGVGYGCMKYGMGLAERGAGRTRMFHLFNPHDHDRSEVAVLTVWDYPGDIKSAAIKTADGEDVPCQLLSTRREDYMGHVCQHVAVKVNVPAFGWNTVVCMGGDDDLVEKEYPLDARVHRPDEYRLENEYLLARFDVKTGALVSLIDKEEGKEMLTAPAGFVTIDEDTDKGMTSWVVGRYMRREPIGDAVRVHYGAAGQLVNSVVLETRFGSMGSTLRCEISLKAGSRRLDFDARCDWKEVGTKETCIPQLAFALPCGAEGDILYDVPGGTVKRAQMDMDVPACHFAASVPENGKAVMLSSDSKYGFRCFGGEMQLTLIRASYDPDPYPERGEHLFKLSVTVTGDKGPADLIRAAEDGARALDYISARPHKGTLPAAGSLISIEGRDTRISAMKVSEDGKAVILRLVNYGEAESVTVCLPDAPGAAWISDALEETLEPLAVSGRKLKVELGAHSVNTVRIE